MKYFLIYIDILGFAKRAKKEAGVHGLEPEEVRNAYKRRIEDKLSELKERNIIRYYTQKEGLDSWLVFTDGIQKVFKSICDVLKAKLPLEVAIGAKKFEKSPAPRDLIVLRDEVMDYLGDNILSSYRKWYRKQHRHSPKQTFILLTAEAYQEFNYKKMCSKPYPSADFYFLKQKEFERKLKILEFLEKIVIGSQRVEYKEIEELYVEPKNYNKIEDILKWHNIVFIIGNAETGKTYTAVKLLFEFFKEGYEPVYIPEEDRREQWRYVRYEAKLEGKAVYLEDPWGKIEFVSGESFFRDIGNLITEAKRKRCKVIVTSREKVFEEFEKRKEISEDLRRYVTEFKVDLTYSKEKLGEMLRRYINVFEPTWHDDEGLRVFAFEAIGEKLRTPMSIRRLIGYTKNVKDEEGLKEGIEKSAEDTKITFAREIKEIFNKGEYDKLVFLCFPYILVNLDVAKSCYNEVLKDLGYDLIKAKDFNDLLEEFNEVEIFLLARERVCVRYIHPLYMDAFEYALVDENKPNNISKKIFSNVLSKLSEKETLWGAVDIAGSVIVNFDKLPKDVWNELVFKLFEKDAYTVASEVVYHFDKLPKDVWTELMFKLSEKAAYEVSDAVVKYFDRLPRDVWTELVFKLSERYKARWWVTRAAVWYFDMFPEDVWNKLLLKLSERDQAIVGDTIEQLGSYGPPSRVVNVKNLLDRLRKWFPFVIEYLLSKEGSKAEVTQNKIKAINLIYRMSSPLIWKIDKIFICSTLGKLSKDEDVEVSRTAQVVMGTFCEDLKGVKNVETG